MSATNEDCSALAELEEVGSLGDVEELTDNGDLSLRTTENILGQ
jgi:hypothetical protein